MQISVTLYSFNPCYVGLWSVSDCRLTPAEINVGFNPCYVGLWSVSAYRVFDLLVKATFQSLLCWIMVCKMIDRISNCENLNEFQSLLCWIMVCKTAYPHLPKPSSTGFNPCYIGLWSVSDCLEALRNLPDKFQSLLCWIMVCKYAITSLCGGDIQFQSLLCWIMVCKKHPSIHKLADVFGKKAIGDVVCDYSTTAIYNLKICDEQDQLPLMDKPHDYPVRRAEMKPWEEN